MANDHISTQQAERKYLNDQLVKAIPFPIGDERNGQIKLQIRTDRNKSNWLNVTVEQYRKIEQILLGE